MVFRCFLRYASSRTEPEKVGLGWVPGGSKYLLRRYDWRCRVCAANEGFLGLKAVVFRLERVT